MSQDKQPIGSQILRTLAMPADTNPHGDIFGGWIMSQMDMAGGVMAQEASGSRVVTVAVDQISFLRPVYVGDVVCCYGKVKNIGNTSITIHLEIWVEPKQGQEIQKDPMYQVTEASFTYVSMDKNNKKQPVMRRC